MAKLARTIKEEPLQEPPRALNRQWMVKTERFRWWPHGSGFQRDCVSDEPLISGATGFSGYWMIETHAVGIASA